MIPGSPSGKRERHRLMVLQAYIDDSGNEPSHDVVCVLGGFVTQTDDWARFSDEWQNALDIHPKFDYFKMSEANSLVEQFSPAKGWTEQLRDSRVSLLADIAHRHTRLATHVYIRHDDFDKYIRSQLMPYRQLSSDHPYPLLCIQLMLQLAEFKSNIGDESGAHMDLFLDTQTGFENDVMQWWRLFLALDDVDGSKLADRLGNNPPPFRNSKQFLPLQAADLFVWHRRLFYNKGEKTKVLEKLEDKPTLCCPIGEKPLKQIGDELARKIRTFSSLNPDEPLLPAGKRSRRITKMKMQK
jgi:hypothetical protein